MALLLSIDPGTTKSAFVVWDGDRIHEKGIIENEACLETIRTISAFANSVVLEMVASYGMAVGKEVFETCVWIGRFWQAAYCDVHLAYRRAVKLHLCHDSRANDSNIRQALVDRFGKPGKKAQPNFAYGETGEPSEKMRADLWQALALAVYWFDTHHPTQTNDGGLSA